VTDPSQPPRHLGEDSPAVPLTLVERIPMPIKLLAAWCLCGLLIAGGVWVFAQLAVLLAPLTIALAATLILTALLQPITDLLCRWRVPRSLAAFAGVLVLLIAVLTPAVLIWRQVSTQFGDLSTRLGEGVKELRDQLTAPGAPFTPEQLDRIGQEVSQLGGNAAGGLAGAMTVVEVLGSMLLVVVLVFFMLKDGRAMAGWIVRRSSDRMRPAIAEVGSASWDTLSRYARGTLAIAAIDAIGIGLALVLLGVPLALPLTLITFVGAFVPILGATVAGSVAVLVALAANGPGTALAVAAAVIAVQQVEGNLLEPLIMKRQIRLHPVVVLVAVTAGTLAWGAAGAFLAVPIVAVLNAAITTLHRWREVNIVLPRTPASALTVVER
jgi:putative heme transporter